MTSRHRWNVVRLRAGHKPGGDFVSPPIGQVPPLVCPVSGLRTCVVTTLAHALRVVNERPGSPPTGTYSVSLRSCLLLFCLSVALCRPVLSFRCACSLPVVPSLPPPLVYVFYAPPAGSASDRRTLTQAHSWALRRVQTKNNYYYYYYFYYCYYYYYYHYC